MSTTDADSSTAPPAVPVPSAGGGGDDANDDSNGNAVDGGDGGEGADASGIGPPLDGDVVQRLIVPGVLAEDDQTTVAIDEHAIADHLEKYLMAPDNKDGCKVYSALLGGIHLYCFPPSDILKRDYWTVCTMGISGTVMKVPRDIAHPERWQRCELICYLPADWEFPAALGGEVTAQSW